MGLNGCEKYQFHPMFAFFPSAGGFLEASMKKDEEATPDPNSNPVVKMSSWDRIIDRWHRLRYSGNIPCNSIGACGLEVAWHKKFCGHSPSIQIWWWNDVISALETEQHWGRLNIGHPKVRWFIMFLIHHFKIFQVWPDMYPFGR